MKILTTRIFDGCGCMQFDFYEAKNDKDAFWLTACQVGQALGYRHAEDAVKNLHKRGFRHLEGLYFDNVEVNVRRKGLISTSVYNFEGAVILAALSNKHNSACFIKFLFDSRDYIAQLMASQKNTPQSLRVIEKDTGDLLTDRIDAQQEKFYSARRIARELGMGLYEFEVQLHNPEIMIHAFMVNGEWYLTEAGRNKALEVLS